MNFLEAIILGFFQGVAEFLPISSSGHLVLIQRLFHITEGNKFYAEMLHFGTLCSILFVYRKQVWKMLREFFAMMGTSVRERRLVIRNRYQKLDLLIIIGSLPTVVIALMFEKIFDRLFSATLFVGIGFMLTGILLFVMDRMEGGQKDAKEMTFVDALVVGIFQGIAIIPGISRSGSTISASLYRGLKRPFATEFSFLFALPVTFGAFLLGMKDVVSGQLGSVALDAPLLVGVFVSFAVGIIAIKAMIRLLNAKKLFYFSYYLWAIGVITIVSSALGWIR